MCADKFHLLCAETASRLKAKKTRLLEELFIIIILVF